MIKLKEIIQDDEYQNKDIVLATILSMFVVISRIIFAEHYFLGYDPVNFTMGSISFSLTETRPHLPGYYLYVKSIQVFHYFISDRHTAFLTLNLAITFAASFFSFLSLKKILSTKTSLLTFMLLIFNPMVWYYSSVTEIYVFDWLLSAFLLFIFLRKNGLYFVFPVIALGTGFRQSSGALLIPFSLYTIYVYFKKRDINYKHLAVSFLSAAIIFAAWFLPMVSNDGGISGYIALYSENNPVEKISLLQNWFRMSSLMVFFALPIVFLIAAIIFKLKRIKLKDNNYENIKLLIAFALFPMLFFIFGHYSKGYLLLIVFPIFAIIGILLEEKILSNFLIGFTTIIEIVMFLFVPYHQESVDSLIRTEIRKASITSLWFDRTFSNYSLTRARINYESDKVAELKNLVEISNSDSIFVDPTLSYYARILQYYFPGKSFLTINLHNTDKLILFNQIKVSLLEKANINLGNVPVLTRNDFIKSYLRKDLFQILVNKSGFSLIKFESKSHFVKIYEKLFSRVY